jgi:S1-C subfamily serine protease
MTTPASPAPGGAGFGPADGEASYGAPPEATSGAPDAPWPAVQPPAVQPPVQGRRRKRFSVGILQLLGLIIIAAVAGGGAALLVARLNGWGSASVVKQYVTSAGAVSDRPVDIKGLLATSLPAVVSVKSAPTQANPFLGSGGGRSGSEGTGIVISGSGEIITNAHVVRGGISGTSTVTVTLQDSRKLAAQIVASDSDNDLALLKVTGVADLPALELGGSGAVAPGDPVIAIGYALGLEGGPSVTTGIISATGRSTATETGAGVNSRLTNLLQTDAPISSGDSGGPLLDTEGHVIGINTMVATSTSQIAANGIGFAIAADTVTSVLEVLRKSG